MANDMIYGDQVKFFWNGYDLSCDAMQAQWRLARPIAKGRTFCGQNVVASNRYDATMSFQGFGMYGSDMSLQELSFDQLTNTGSDDLIEAIAGQSAGAIGHLVTGLADERSEPFQANSGDPIQISGSISGSQAARTVSLANGATISATGALTGQTFGYEIAAGQKMVFVMRCTGGTALTSLIAKVEESADSTDGTDGTWGDAETASITLSALNTSDIAVTAALSAAMGPWFRLNVTTFTGTSPTVTATAGELAS